MEFISRAKNLSFHIKADEEIWHEKEIEVTLAGEKISTEKTENGNCIDYKVKMDSVSQGEQEFFIKCRRIQYIRGYFGIAKGREACRKKMQIYC